MQLQPEKLDQHLEKTLAPLYVITSDEHLLLLEATDKIRKTAVENGITEREILTTSEKSFKWNDLLAANNVISLFGDKKLIELRVPSTGTLKKEGAHALQQYITELNPDNVTIITLPRLDRTAKNSSWFKSLQEHAVYLEIPVVERSQLSRWIAIRLKQQNQSANEESIEFLVNMVEGNLLAAHQEIRKLGLLYPEGPLNFEQIKDAVLNVARYDIFKLNETMLSGDVSRFVRMMEGLKGEGAALPLVLNILSEEIRTLLKLKTAISHGQSIDILMKNLRIWGPRERLIRNIIHQLSIETLQKALQQAAQVDKIVKGLRVTTLVDDAWDALLQLGLSIMTQRMKNT